MIRYTYGTEFISLICVRRFTLLLLRNKTSHMHFNETCSNKCFSFAVYDISISKKQLSSYLSKKEFRLSITNYKILVSLFNDNDIFTWAVCGHFPNWRTFCCLYVTRKQVTMRYYNWQGQWKQCNVNMHLACGYSISCLRIT